MPTYRIDRIYKDSDNLKERIKRGLTLDEAQAWCRDIETSSSTCTNPIGEQRTRSHGEWFDSYEEEK